MKGELIALVDGEIGEGRKGGMMLGTGITDTHAVDKMLAMVETLKGHPMLSQHLTKVTFVSVSQSQAMFTPISGHRMMAL